MLNENECEQVSKGALFSSFTDDPEFGPVVAAVIEKLPLRTQELKQHASRHRWSHVRTQAHQLVGVGGLVGIPEISFAARAIEAGCSEAIDPTAIINLVSDLDALSQRALATLIANTPSLTPSVPVEHAAQ